MKILCEKAITSCDYSTHILLLDMTKAFDTTDINIDINREHLYKLLSDILDPDELIIMNILLKDVTLQVKNNITKGQTSTTTLGIPQGDCLSAILFTLYLSNTLSAKIPTHLNDHTHDDAHNMFRTPFEHLHDHNYLIKQDKNIVTDYTILVHRLHTDFGFTDTVLQWFSSYLTDRTHYVSLCNHCSDFAPVHSGVPQGSVLGPILFTMYIKPLSAIIDSHSIIHHSFADDLQLQMSAPPDRISELLHSMQSCISDVKAWATVNMLRLNDSKTELMLVTSKRSKHLHNLPTSITIGNAQIPFKQSVKNLGFTLDCHLTMNAHVSNIARTCYFELRRLAYIRRFLTSTATATLVSAFVLSRIDYCNSLLFGSTLDVTSHLQRIQNYAARVILRLPMSSRITIHLKSLHWLPVKVRSTYKIACLCYHCHSSTAPSYVTDMLHKKPLHTRNTRSSSYTMPLLNRPAHSKATLGDRSFSFASSSVWNSIPNDVKCAPSLSSFKSRLKTYLFHSVYKD